MVVVSDGVTDVMHPVIIGMTVSDALVLVSGGWVGARGLMWTDERGRGCWNMHAQAGVLGRPADVLARASNLSPGRCMLACLRDSNHSAHAVLHTRILIPPLLSTLLDFPPTGL